MWYGTVRCNVMGSLLVTLCLHMCVCKALPVVRCSFASCPKFRMIAGLCDGEACVGWSCRYTPRGSLYFFVVFMPSPSYT